MTDDEFQKPCPSLNANRTTRPATRVMAPSEAEAPGDGPFGGPGGASDDEWLADDSPGPTTGPILGAPVGSAEGTASMGDEPPRARVEGEGSTHATAGDSSAAGSTNGEVDRPFTPPPPAPADDWLGGAPTPSDYAPENEAGWSSLDNSFASKPPPSPLGPDTGAAATDPNASWIEHRASPFGGNDSPRESPSKSKPAAIATTSFGQQPAQTFVVKKASSLGDLFGGGGEDLDADAYVSPVAAQTNPFASIVDDDDAFFDQLAGAPRQATPPPSRGAAAAQPDAAASCVPDSASRAPDVAARPADGAGGAGGGRGGREPSRCRGRFG